MPLVSHQAVPVEDVKWIHDFKTNEAVSFEVAIRILRRTKFPFHYDPHPWTPGKRIT